MSLSSKIKKAVKLLAPPRLLLPFRKPHAVSAQEGAAAAPSGPPPLHQGNYPSWAAATAAATGYDAASILDIQRASMRKVRDGEAVYERDSVLFDEIEYFFPTLAALLFVASRNNGRLSVLDFGGALGSSYYQNRNMLSHLPLLSWHVVEQPHFVATGQAEFENGSLRFFPNLATAWQGSAPDVVLLSSVLQYLEDPMALLAEIAARSPPFILVDRTPVLDQGAERIVVQNVPPSIYPASYACRLFAPDAIPQALAKHYDFRYSFEAHIGNIIRAGDAQGRYRGYFLERRVS